MEGLLERSKISARRAEYEAELACPPLPQELAYLWRAYHRLRRRKGGNGFGPAPIEWPDIDAFERRAKFAMAPWEIEIIEMLDDLYLTQRVGEKAAPAPESN